MRLGFAAEASRRTGVQRLDLIERDMILHRLLQDLSGDPWFHGSFLLKGGTCLIKSYQGYYRFSEDLDFTWRDQSLLAGLSQKKVRRTLSATIGEAGSLVQRIADSRGLDFKPDKSDPEFVELGGSDKSCTFKLWYTSEATRRPSFLKLQFNYVERLIYPSAPVALGSLLTGADPATRRDLEFLYPDEASYLKAIPFQAYDPREIFCEKVRAILTRDGFKARDFVDTYLLSKRPEIQAGDLRGACAEKTAFSLGLYEKYRRNFEEKKRLVGGDFFSWGEERELLLRELDEGFYEYVDGLRSLLLGVIADVDSKLGASV